MAKFNNVEYREVDVRPCEQVSELGWSLRSTKTVDYSITAVCMCFKAIHEDGFKVAANALGIDELFAGYGIHRGTFARMKGHGPHMVPSESMKVGGKYARGAARTYGTDAAFFTSNMMYAPYRTIVKDIHRYNPRNFYSMSKEDNLWNTVQRWTLLQMIGFYTGSISRAGKATGVEVLFPYHDQDLVQTCINIPPADKYNKKPIRSLMRATYGIPAEIAQRGAKWDKLAWGGTILPYLECKEYMKEATSNLDAASDWFEDWAASAFMKGIGRNKTRMGLQMLLFTRMLQELK
jgi:asparagine synthetase B (glutamine-hydrolysing)